MGIDMKNIFTRLTLLGLLLGLAFTTQAQPGGKASKDSRANNLVSLAKRYFKTQNYLDAAITFDLATQRPYNQQTTYSVYMAGLSYYRLGEMEKALDKFDTMLKDYSKSKFKEDATYHRSLVLMSADGTNDREKGMDGLFKLMDETRDGTLKSACESQIKDHIFNKYPLNFLDLYILFAPETYKPWFVEAACFQLEAEGQGYVALERIAEHEAKGGMMTDYLNGLKGKFETGEIVNPGRLNIAIFLSLNLQTLDTAQAVPKRSLWAVEMLEGMKIALDSIGDKMNKQVNVRIFDTRGDTSVVRMQIDSLADFQPTVIVGDVRSAMVRPISNWAEENKVLHIIPRNPVMRLVKDKRYTFLAHPALETHGAQMAAHAYHQENKRKFLVFNDHSFVSERFATAFKKVIDSTEEGSVTMRDVAMVYADNRKSIPSFVKSLKYQDYDAIYIPLPSEESAGLIISQLNYHRVEIPVMGGPDWEIFNVIDPELKTKYELQYSTFFYEKNDSVMYDSLTASCLMDYAYKPSKNTLLGFDIMAYTLELAKTMNGMTDPGDLVRNAPVFHGIHQDFYYGGEQNNQMVNIIKFEDGRTKKVNWNTTQ